MPPRSVKRGAAANRRTTGRTTRGSQKAKDQLPPEDLPEEPVVSDEGPIAAVEVKEEDSKVCSEEPVGEDERAVVEPHPPVSILFFKPELELEYHGVKKEDKMKESVDEYEKDERLELEDNDPEYETEEYGIVDYDEKVIDPEEDVEEIGDEAEEEDLEENLDEDDDVDEEELDVVHEDGEEFEEPAEEEPVRVERVDADEAEHHEVVKERRKRKEFEIFIGGLDKEASESDLRKAFSTIGEVTEVRLMMNPQTKKNKGFAFLRFAKVEQAKRAVTELKHPVINGKKCGVTPSQDSDTLFLGNICKTWTKEALKEKLKHYGVENVEDLTLVEDTNSQGLNRGFAFLEFSSRSEAMEAFKRLQKRDIVFGVDRPAKVSFADSFIDPGDEIMAQVKTVFVDGLPTTWNEDRLRGYIKKYGEIVKIELARNMPSAKRKDFGFVTFSTHDAAVTCAKGINNAELGDGETKVKVRARLSRPLQKGKGKHVGRGDFRSSRSSGRAARSSWGVPSPRKVSSRGSKGSGSRVPPSSLKRSSGIRDRRAVVSVQARARPLPPSSRTSYDRRPPVSSHPKSSLKREYNRREEIPPPRSRATADYSPRVVLERRQSYREEYISRGPGYSDPPRSTSRTSTRRAYPEDEYSHRYERPPPPPPPSYRDLRGRDYDTVPGSKRPYSSMDDIPPRYTDSSIRQSRARLDYEYAAGSAAQYGDAYGDRLGRSNLGYSSSSRTSHDSHGLYSSRHGMGYGGASYGGNDVGGMYSSGYGGEYVSRGSDVGGSSYSSMYSGRGGGSSYMGSGGSSYY